MSAPSKLSAVRKTALVGVVTIAVLLSLSVYMGSTSAGTPSTSTSTAAAPASTTTESTVIRIPPGSYHEPSGFNVTQLLTGKYPYPFNFTVVIGSNNTVQWINDDTVAHTVSSFVVPPGSQTFNSDLIQPDHGFTVTLSVPGVYKYTCMWHPWLSGEITVKAA